MGELTRVKVDFATSHLIFPTVIGAILALLAVAILFTEYRNILASGPMWRQTLAKMDKLRFFGTLVLTIVYFSLMVPVGDIWPNTGLGFLICSVPFILAIGLLYMHERRVRDIIPLAIVAIVAPVSIWWLFNDVFFLTLP
ncbi:tripartite tricarboxylate transporter TctB family protein [Agrobacterium salinitolerans]